MCEKAKQTINMLNEVAQSTETLTQEQRDKIHFETSKNMISILGQLVDKVAGIQVDVAVIKPQVEMIKEIQTSMQTQIRELGENDNDSKLDRRDIHDRLDKVEKAVPQSWAEKNWKILVFSIVGIVGVISVSILGAYAISKGQGDIISHTANAVAKMK